MSLPTSHTTTTTTHNTLTSKDCTSCSTRTPSFLHNVRHRGIYRRLCTSCVLRLHPASFCPSCFQLHDPTPPHPHKRVTCTNCNSITHSHCIPSHKVPYLCPPCAGPKFVFFDGGMKTVDEGRAVVLLCAARIAAVSMGKAVVWARAEAERKVREAAVAGKRAREALEGVAGLREERVRVESAVKVERVENGN